LRTKNTLLTPLLLPLLRAEEKKIYYCPAVRKKERVKNFFPPQIYYPLLNHPPTNNLFCWIVVPQIIFGG